MSAVKATAESSEKRCIGVAKLFGDQNIPAVRYDEMVVNSDGR